MKGDKSAQDIHESRMSGDFDQNYRFLSELIHCKDKNNASAKSLEEMADRMLSQIRGKLNRRQIAILNRYLKVVQEEDRENIIAPVPPELEASIRVRKRATWLPWEAEAIRKIDRWRSDIQNMVGIFGDAPRAPLAVKKLAIDSGGQH
ncbi:MAG: hypothetical protein FJY85_01090 [Deltaproteobacteria bacterium]|nr:hypothetical protein [Deltaproteobacteria bacterium]